MKAKRDMETKKMKKKDNVKKWRQKKGEKKQEKTV